MIAMPLRVEETIYLCSGITTEFNALACKHLSAPGRIVGNQDETSDPGLPEHLHRGAIIAVRRQLAIQIGELDVISPSDVNRTAVIPISDIVATRHLVTQTLHHLGHDGIPHESADVGEVFFTLEVSLEIDIFCVIFGEGWVITKAFGLKRHPVRILKGLRVSCPNIQPRGKFPFGENRLAPRSRSEPESSRYLEKLVSQATVIPEAKKSDHYGLCDSDTNRFIASGSLAAGARP